MTISIESARPGDLPAILELLEQSGLPRERLVDHLPTALVGYLLLPLKVRSLLIML